MKPGGIVVFHEMDFSFRQPTYPPCELFDQIAALVPEIFRRVGLPPDFGRRLAKPFLDAGLPFPSMVAEAPVGGESGSYLYSWAASNVASLAPRFAELGLLLPPGVVADSTLAARLEAAMVAHGSQLVMPTQYGAWTRKPR